MKITCENGATFEFTGRVLIEFPEYSRGTRADLALSTAQIAMMIDEFGEKNCSEIEHPETVFHGFKKD